LHPARRLAVLFANPLFPEALMVPWSALFLPALVATVLVFIASSIVHMVLKLHNPDYRKLPNEDEVRAAIRRGAPLPGQYVMPHCTDSKQMASPDMAKKFEEGPNAVLYVRANGAVKLGPFLGKWIAYSFLVSLFAGYLAQATLPPGTEYLRVFQVVGAAAWLAYSWQQPSDSIWKGKPWSVTIRGMFDGLVYAALTAGSFAWLWPKAVGA
jgi:hypothetical protein